MRRCCLFLPLGLLLLIGCGKTPPAKPGTGARQVAEEFATALAKQDWPTAYSLLHPTTQGRLRPQEFARRAAIHQRGIGFVPARARVRFCEERGDEANAHVSFIPASHAKRGQFRDGWPLRRVENRWLVVLPAKFGGR